MVSVDVEQTFEEKKRRTNCCFSDTVFVPLLRAADVETLGNYITKYVSCFAVFNILHCQFWRSLRSLRVGALAMSTFSPVGSRSSNGMRMCVCVRACVDGMNLKYALRWHIHMYQFIPCYASTRTSSNHLRTANRRGLKVDIAGAFGRSIHLYPEL